MKFGLLCERRMTFDELRLRVEVQVLAVHHLDGAIVSHELFAVTVLVVPEVAGVVEVEAVRILIYGAEGIGNLAVIMELFAPLVDAA